jgi:potato proteinase inhibitor type I family protein
MSSPKIKQVDWKQFLGMDVDKAIQMIRQKRPQLDVFKCQPGLAYTADYRSSRVRVFYDKDNKVSHVPHPG